MTALGLYEVDMASKVEYPATIATNTAVMGLRHILLRHPSLFHNKLVGLPPNLAHYAAEIRRSHKTNNQQDAFDKMLLKERDEVVKSKRKRIISG